MDIYALTYSLQASGNPEQFAQSIASLTDEEMEKLLAELDAYHDQENRRYKEDHERFLRVIREMRSPSSK